MIPSTPALWFAAASPIFPSYPGESSSRGESAGLFSVHRPAVVAVEFPPRLEEVYEIAVARLPQMSVVVIPEREDQERATYIPVEPADPFVEAVRSAHEIGAETLFLEPATHDKPHLPDNYPGAIFS